MCYLAVIKISSLLSRVQYRFFRYYGYTIKNPAWLLMFLVGRINLIRDFVSLFYQVENIDRHPEKQSLFKNIEVSKIVESLHRDGYFLGINLPSAIVNDIVRSAYSIKIQARHYRDLQFFYADKKQLSVEPNKDIVHGYYTDVNANFPWIGQLKHDPKLLQIAALYLGCHPVHVRTDLSWYFVAPREAYEKYGDAQISFHYDLDDYHTLKFFFFLTDVDLLSGPHVCVRGSHNHKKLRHQLSWLIGQSDREIVESYGQKNLVNICGSAGFGFAEDPFCFHRGTPPQRRDRLMLQIEFAVNNYGMWTIAE